MKRTVHWSQLGAATLLAALLALPAVAEDDKSGQDRNNDEQQAQSDKGSDKDQTRELKAFDLEHRKPQEIQQILALRKQAARTPAGTVAPGQPHAVRPRTAGFRPQQDRMALAADNENNVLFVRGSSDQIKEVEELVDALDVSAGDLEKKKIGDTRLIPISADSTARVRSALTQLQLDHQLMQLEDVSLIVVCTDGSDESEKKASQVEEVVSKLEADKDLGGSSEQDSDNDDNGSSNNNG